MLSTVRYEQTAKNFVCSRHGAYINSMCCRTRKKVYQCKIVNSDEDVMLLERITHTLLTCLLNSTQLNSTNHPKRKRVVYKRKEAIKAYINPRFFSKQSRCFLKVATVSQLINDTGKLFHTSIILTVKKKFLTSKFTCGL